MACNWIYPTPGSNPTADSILAVCVTEHECTHFDDVNNCASTCPALTRPLFANLALPNRIYQECVGWTTELRCLQWKRQDCAGNAACLAQIDARIAQLAAGLPALCGTYTVPSPTPGCGNNIW